MDWHLIVEHLGGSLRCAWATLYRVAAGPRDGASVASVSARSGCDRCRKVKRKSAVAAARALDTTTRHQRTIVAASLSVPSRCVSMQTCDRHRTPLSRPHDSQTPSHRRLSASGPGGSRRSRLGRQNACRSAQGGICRGGRSHHSSRRHLTPGPHRRDHRRVSIRKAALKP